MENIVLKASDGYALSLAVFESEHPRGYIQIIHGMEEHKERYEAFAEQLRQVGFTVVTSDMRGLYVHRDAWRFFKCGKFGGECSGMLCVYWHCRRTCHKRNDRTKERNDDVSQRVY